MKILAVETTGRREGVAIYDDGKMTEVEREVESHCPYLLENIDKVLKKAGTRLKDLDCLAASTGQGSFIGMRVGLSTMQGLGLALNIPVIEVKSTIPTARNVVLLAAKKMRRKQ